jgi:hypothetical protein
MFFLPPPPVAAGEEFGVPMGPYGRETSAQQALWAFRFI